MIGSDFLQLDLHELPAGTRTDRLADEIRSAIATGRLQVGTALPPSRVLAADLGCARGTVTEAYQRLGEEGLVQGRPGAGTAVIARPASTFPPAAPTPPTAPPTSRPIDLSRSLPDLTAFPRAAWLRAEKSVLDVARAADLSYAPTAGAPQLRKELAAWLARSRGVLADPDRVIITGGVTGALSLLAQVMRNRGQDEIALEDPGAIGNRRILSAWLPRLSSTPVDEHGINAAAISATASAVLVTPAHQYPTGVALSATRRRDLLDWATSSAGLIIEDDYDAEYRYDRRPIRALQGLAPEQVAYTSSLSKTLSPGLRLGWLVPPSSWHAELVDLRWAIDLGSPVLPQLVLAELLRSGALERHLRLMRRRHRQRRDALLHALGQWLPELSTSGLAAGLHLILHLRAGHDDEEIAAAAAAAGVLVQALRPHYSDEGPPGLVLNYAAHHRAELVQAVEVLARVIPR